MKSDFELAMEQRLHEIVVRAGTALPGYAPRPEDMASARRVLAPGALVDGSRIERMRELIKRMQAVTAPAYLLRAR